MTKITPNLGLTTYSTITDASSVLIYTYINTVSGSGIAQNLGIIDAYAGEISASIISLNTSVSALELASSTAVKSAVAQVVERTTDVDTTSGIFYFRIPTEFNGKSIVRAIGFVDTASIGSSASTVVQIRNTTKYPSNDALSSPIIIYDGKTTGCLAAIHTSYDDVSTDDVLKFYVKEEEVDKPKGLQISVDFQ